MPNPIKCAWPPKTYTLFGVRYIAGGDHIIEVPLDTKTEDIHKYMIWEGKETSASVFGKTKTLEQEWSTEILSSNKKDKYRVILRCDQWVCPCMGFSFKRKCSHIEKAKVIRKQE